MPFARRRLSRWSTGRSIFDDKRGYPQCQSDRIYGVEANIGSAVACDTAIEDETDYATRKQPAKDRDEHDKRRLSRHRPRKRSRADERRCKEETGVLRSDFIIAARICNVQPEPRCELGRRASTSPGCKREEQSSDHQNDRSKHTAPPLLPTVGLLHTD